MWEIFSALVLAYVIGSIQPGYFVGILKGVDIRTVGSGSTGATNVNRALGKKWALIIFLLDASKGALCILIAALVLGLEGVLLASVLFCAGLGHVYPFYLGFRGGKGVSTLSGGLAVLGSYPIIVPLVVGMWCVVFIATRTTSKANLLLFFFGIPPALYFSHGSWHWFAVGIGMFLFIAWTHRENIVRIFKGEEQKVDFRK